MRTQSGHLGWDATLNSLSELECHCSEIVHGHILQVKRLIATQFSSWEVTLLRDNSHCHSCSSCLNSIVIHGWKKYVVWELDVKVILGAGYAEHG